MENDFPSKQTIQIQWAEPAFQKKHWRLSSVFVFCLTSWFEQAPGSVSYPNFGMIKVFLNLFNFLGLYCYNEPLESNIVF